MKDSTNKTLKAGYLATITVAVRKIEGDSVTVDLGGGHLVTLNKEQVKNAVTQTGEKALVDEPAGFTGATDREIAVPDTASSRDDA